MTIKDRYDGITVGTLCTERWIEKNAVLSILLGKAYVPAIRFDLDAQDVGVKNLGVDDASNVYEITAPPFNPSGGVDVRLQDQTTPVAIGKFWLLAFEGATTTEAVIDTRDVDVAPGDIGNFNAGDYIHLFNVAANRFYQGRVVSVSVNTITMDTPFDFSYPIGSVIASGSSNIGVNGLVTRKIFRVRSTEARIPTVFDMTRLIFTCIGTSAMDYTLFANLSALIHGIVVRRNDGTITNYFNVKSNKEFAALMYDFRIFAATNPVQGVDGFVGRLTFAGQNKIGVAIRLQEDEDLELIVQDDLSLITLFEVTAEGHVVD